MRATLISLTVLASLLLMGAQSCDATFEQILLQNSLLTGSWQGKLWWPDEREVDLRLTEAPGTGLLSGWIYMSYSFGYPLTDGSRVFHEPNDVGTSLKTIVRFFGIAHYFDLVGEVDASRTGMSGFVFQEEPSGVWTNLGRFWLARQLRPDP